MMARSKFMFDTDFGVGSRAEPKITAAAVEEAERRGYRNGLMAAEAQARTEAERRAAEAFERIASALDKLARDITDVELKLEAEAVEIAFAVARKLAPELIARQPLAEIAALAGSTLSELMSAPHVVVRVHESLHATAKDKLEEIARMRGFEGRLVVLGETEIAPGDCRIEWAEGGVVRDRAAIEAAVAEAVGRYVAAHCNGVQG
jgi:flagellar assembly protein FliH